MKGRQSGELIDFRVRRSRKSEIGRLYGYLKRDPRGKQKFEEAVFAFWMPMAHYEESGDLSEARGTAMKAIALLEAQAQIIRMTFDLQARQACPTPNPQLEIFPPQVEGLRDNQQVEPMYLEAEDYLFDDE
ncbi:MAG: hypothetical protein D6694_09160 [Gammaproteobacteria bacterium]|nr:MAG: hypothetical protein D6694_09160 [Gammaproteobacteria bacterium]